MSRFTPAFAAIRQAQVRPSTVLTSPKHIQQLDLDDCVMWAIAVKSQKDKACDTAFLPEMMAVISQAVLLTTSHKPRITQILSLLTLLESDTHGRLAEIATGQGKSLIVAMLAIIKALRGHQVDIVTSSSVLAVRETVEQKRLFDCFNLTVSHSCHTSDLYFSGAKPCYFANILYSDVSSFQFDLLRHEYKGNNTRGDRPFDVVIVDEVDNMLIDESSKIAALGSYKPAMEHLEPVLISTWVELNRLLIEETSDHFIVEVLTKYIIAIMDGDEKQIHLPHHLKAFAKSQAPYWARSAVLAHSVYQLNKQYVIGTDSTGTQAIIPIDYQNTGVIHDNAAWDDGLHQFLQIKHGLLLQAENLTGGFISNVSYFRRYGKNIFGLTGTIGNRDTQKTLEDLYGIDVKFIPSFCEKSFVENPGLLLDNETQWKASIIRGVQNEISNNRSVLIICESILSVDNIESALKIAGIQNIRRYTRADNHEKNAIEAPVDSGDVIIATNLAGRGTDIKTTDQVEAHGGMHVVVTYLPDNERVEKQAFGRTSRQEKRGSAQLIINKTDAVSKLHIHFQETLHPITVAELKTWRDQVDAKNLSIMKGPEIEKILFKDRLFQQFCEVVKQLSAQEPNTFKLDDIEERWGLWLKETERALSKNNLDNKATILASFEKFKVAILSEYANCQLQNPCQWIRLGNHKITRAQYEEAIQDYQRAIDIDPVFAVHAYYNRAYTHILARSANYKSLAVSDLNTARSIIIEQFIPQLQIALVRLMQLKQSDSTENAISEQLHAKVSCYRQQIENIDFIIQKITGYDGDLDIDFDRAKSLSSFPEDISREFSNNGLFGLFSVKEIIARKKKGWGIWLRRLTVAFLGVCQVVAGVFMSAAGNVYLGKSLIEMGVSDMALVVRSALQNTACSWSEYRSHKIISSAIILGSLGIDIVRKTKALDQATVKQAINKQATLNIAKEKIVSALSTATITETVNLGMHALEKAAIRNYASNIEDRVRDSVKNSFINTDFIENLNIVLSVDQQNGNHLFQQRLQQLIIELINSRSDQLFSHSRTILKGILANQHPALRVGIAFADIGDGIRKIMDLCDNFCDAFQHCVAQLAHDVSKENLTINDYMSERESLCQQSISLLTQATMTKIHHSLVSRVVDLAMRDHLQALTKIVQTVAHGSIRSAQLSEEEIARCRHKSELHMVRAIENIQLLPENAKVLRHTAVKSAVSSGHPWIPRSFARGMTNSFRILKYDAYMSYHFREKVLPLTENDNMSHPSTKLYKINTHTMSSLIRINANNSLANRLAADSIFRLYQFQAMFFETLRNGGTQGLNNAWQFVKRDPLILVHPILSKTFWHTVKSVAQFSADGLMLTLLPENFSLQRSAKIRMQEKAYITEQLIDYIKNKPFQELMARAIEFGVEARLLVDIRDVLSRFSQFRISPQHQHLDAQVLGRFRGSAGMMINTNPITPAQANAIFVAYKMHAPYENLSRPRTILLSRDTTFVRVYSHKNSASGQWILRKKELGGLSSKQIRDKYALPNEPTHIVEVLVPANTSIRTGFVSKHPQWGAGQGIQYQLLERLPERSFQKPMRLEEYLRRLTVETRSSFERRLERLANTRPLPGFEKLVRESSHRLSSIGAVKRWALQNRISAAQLPNNGMFAYRAPKDYRFLQGNYAPESLQHVGRAGRYVDFWGNEWRNSPSLTKGEYKKFDVYLSQKGIHICKERGIKIHIDEGGQPYINVSLRTPIGRSPKKDKMTYGVSMAH